MDIKYDDLELMELFYSEGTSLTGDLEDGSLLYKRYIGNFQLTMFIYTYEKNINLFLQYKEKDLVSIEIKEVTELKKIDNYLKIYRGAEEIGSVLFGECFSINID